MYFNPPSLVLTILLVAVTGWVIRGLMASWFKLQREDGSSGNLTEMDERLRKVETATSSLLIEMTSMREKERFMAKLQASAPVRDNIVNPAGTASSDISPMDTQSIPVMPRARLPR